MRKIFITFVLCLSVLCLIKTEKVHAKNNDIKIVKHLCKSLKKPIKLVSYDSNLITHRKNKNFIVVEKVVSYSSGNKYGWTKDGCYIAYNKKVRKHKKVISYFIYNPYSNYCDDILWAVDNNKFR